MGSGTCDEWKVVLQLLMNAIVTCTEKKFNNFSQSQADKELTIKTRLEKSCLAYKKYMLFSTCPLTLLKAVRQMFKLNEDPPLELEAESSN